MTPPVDKNICLAILDRGLRWAWRIKVFPTKKLRKKEFFRGTAGSCLYYYDPEFQNLMEQHGIKPETRIAVAAMETLGDFAVIKV